MRPNQLLKQVADRQAGYFTSRQAMKAGYNNQLQNYHTQSGNWTKIDWALYRLKGYPDSVESSFIRWTLWAAGKSQTRVSAISHESALYYYGLQIHPPQVVHLSISSPVRRALTDQTCVLHLEALLPQDYIAVVGFNLTTVCRTLRSLQPDLTLNRRWDEVVCQARDRGLLSREDATEMRYVSKHSVGSNVPSVPTMAGAAKEDGLLSDLRGRIRTGRYERGVWSAPGRSFTLIEMLVVIAILMIMAGLLLPSLHTAVGTARATNCSNNLRMVYSGLITYADSHQGYLVPCLSPVGQTAASSARLHWQTSLSEYVTGVVYTGGLVFDQSYAFLYQNRRSSGFQAYRCPADQNTWMYDFPVVNTGVSFSYAVPVSVGSAVQSYKRMMNIKRPSQKIYLVDSIVREIFGSEYVDWINPSNPGLPDFLRHQSYCAQTVFLDGHVGKINYSPNINQSDLANLNKN